MAIRNVVLEDYNYVVVNREASQELSDRACKLLLHLSQFYGNFNPTDKSMSKMLGWSMEKYRQVKRELREAGYLSVERTGRNTYDYTVGKKIAKKIVNPEKIKWKLNIATIYKTLDNECVAGDVVYAGKRPPVMYDGKEWRNADWSINDDANRIYRS